MTEKIKVILLGGGERSGVLNEVERLRAEILQCADIVAEDFYAKKDFSETEANLAIVFGGDGSVLRAVHQIGKRQIPVIAVSLGTLSFLADVQPNELIQLLKQPDLLQKPVTEHLLLSCQLIRNGEIITNKDVCLNEVCIQGNDFRTLQVELLIDSAPVSVYRCDGLILSTPVGSTAHNLSAGGPILRKDLDCVVISPISPHTLSHRPVVDSAARTYELRIHNPDAALVVDGTHIATILQNDRIIIKRAGVTFKMLEIPTHRYYKTLREKLGWSGHIVSLSEKIT